MTGKGAADCRAAHRQIRALLADPSLDLLGRPVLVPELPGEPHHIFALLDAKMAAMAHGFLLRCMRLRKHHRRTAVGHFTCSGGVALGVKIRPSISASAQAKLAAIPIYRELQLLAHYLVS